MSRVLCLSLAVLFVSACAALHTDSFSSTYYQRTVTGGVVEGTADPFYPSVLVWKGIPFAQPPVGSLRFAAPLPNLNWTGVKHTKKFASGCMGTCTLPRPEATCTPTVSEDCLYLNVFTPTNATTATLPVFFFIHGGGFTTGSGGVPLYESAQMATQQNIVVVTINYRLGMFGALYTKDNLRGNFMLQDQRLAMQWVQANIAQFGGDPTRVTIGGQSAGAMSTGCHLVSPKSAGLFAGAIMSSNPYGLPYQNPTLAASLGEDALKKLGCTMGGAQELVCLRSKTAEELLAVSNDTRNFPWPDHALMAMVPWVPVANTEDLPEQPLDAAMNGNFTKVPVFMGTASNDSVLFVAAISDKPVDALELDAMLTYLFGLKDTIAIRELFGDVPDKKDTRIYLSHVATNYMFFCPSRVAVQGFSKHLAPFNISAYQWVFSHLPSFNQWLWENNTPLCDEYVCHADDLPFVFGTWYAEPEKNHPLPTAAEVTLSTYLQDAYGRFVRTGSLEGLNPAWPAYTKEQNEAMNLLAQGPGPVKNYQEKYCQYFDSIGYSRE